MKTVLNWVNIPLWKYQQREFRRIDAILIVAGIICVGYYATFGWMAALQGGLLFVLMVMIGLWLL